MEINRVNPRWRPGWFWTLNGLALLLIGSWLWPVTGAIWASVDESFFRAVNGTLTVGRWWSGIWAVGNSRYLDYLTALIMLVLILRKDLIFKENEVRRALFTMGGLMGALVVFNAILNFLADRYGWQRQSPSRVLDGAVRLGQIFPEMKKYARMKDSSPRSFPGDHASVLILWALFLVPFARRGWAAFIIFIAALFSFPRMIAGAHWFSDVMMGAIFLAMLAYAWGYCTPILHWVNLLLERIARPIIVQLRRFPVLRDMALLK